MLIPFPETTHMYVMSPAGAPLCVSGSRGAEQGRPSEGEVKHRTSRGAGGVLSPHICLGSTAKFISFFLEVRRGCWLLAEELMAALGAKSLNVWAPVKSPRPVEPAVTAPRASCATWQPGGPCQRGPLWEGPSISFLIHSTSVHYSPPS